MIRLTVRQMEYFEALTQTRHFGRAARLVGVSQPALSSQVAEMEQRLGLKLFARGGREVQMTEEARVLGPRIERILEDMRALEADVRQSGPAMSGRLRLGIIPTLAPYIFPRALPQLRELFPALGLELREAVTGTLIDETAAGRLDAALVALPVSGPGISSIPLFQDRFLLALPASEPGFVEPPVPPESPILERLMLLEEGHCMREQALEVCGRIKPKVMANYGATSLTTLLQMVSHGFGVTLVPEIAVPAMTGMRDVRLVPFSEPAPYRTIALAYARSGSTLAECKAIGGVLQGLFGQDASAGGQSPRDQRPHRA
jgi:LysR family hydrogen peroxide-inducible transcriptional activator